MSLGMSSEKKERRRLSCNDLDNGGEVELSSMVSCVDQLCCKYGVVSIEYYHYLFTLPPETMLF